MLDIFSACSFILHVYRCFFFWLCLVSGFICFLLALHISCLVALHQLVVVFFFFKSNHFIMKERANTERWHGMLFSESVSLSFVVSLFYMNFKLFLFAWFLHRIKLVCVIELYFSL